MTSVEHNLDQGELLDQLRLSLGLLQVAFDASEQPMLILDSTNKVRWGNQAAADTWTNGIAILLPSADFADLVQLETPNGQPIKATEPTHPLLRMKLADGDDRYLLRKPGETGGSCEAYRVQWRKVTEVPGGFVLFTFATLELAEKALLQQQRFVNQLAHELRTPLAIVNGCLKRIIRSTEKEEKAQKQLLIARQETRRIDRLLEQLSLLTQLDIGSYEMLIENRSLGSFLDGWFDQLEQETRKRVSIEINALNLTKELLLDQHAFNRVLNNLIENSLRFSPGQSPIVITANARHDQMDVRLMDHGPGIPESSHETIFDRFRRLETFRSESHSDGSGLGLAVVQMLIRAMNGSVHIVPNQRCEEDSTPGTIVSMMLPLSQKETKATLVQTNL